MSLTDAHFHDVVDVDDDDDAFLMSVYCCRATQHKHSPNSINSILGTVTHVMYI